MRFVAPPPFFSFLSRRSFSTNTTIPSSSSSSSILTPDDLTRINTLIRRLCDSNHLQEAIRLLSASLLPSPPLSSLPAIPFLADRLASLPTSGDNSMAPAMSLLTTLRHHNPPPSPAIPFCSNLLISSYLRRRRLREAYKVFSWLLRDDSPCRPDKETYRIVVGGLCGESGRAAEVVRAVREMVRDAVEVDEEVRGWVWRSLLTEARVEEAKEIDTALAAASGGGGGGDGGDGVGKLLDRMIREWEE